MNIQFISEFLGTAAFAVSGAMLAIERKMDIFGILFLGMVTAMGGGFIRDMSLGRVPPAMFRTSVFLTVALLISLCTYFAFRWKFQSVLHLYKEKFQWVLNFTDAIGLGLFSVTGVNVAIDAGYGEYHAYAVFLGMLTGVGGGMLRDIMAGLTPAVLRKHVYASASLLGAVCYDVMLFFMPRESAMFLASMIVIVVRMVAYHFKWNLPKAIQ